MRSETGVTWLGPVSGIMPLGERPLSRTAKELLLSRHVDQACQALGLGARHPPAQVRYPVIAASLVVHLWVGALVGLFDEPIGEHAFYGTVERPRT
jgi:hypothetical protein